jgi:hypothetical protein
MWGTFHAHGQGGRHLLPDLSQRETEFRQGLCECLSPLREAEVQNDDCGVVHDFGQLEALLEFPDDFLHQGSAFG